MTDEGHVLVMGPCQSGKSGKVTPRLYNFVTNTTEPLDLAQLTDEKAVELIPVVLKNPAASIVGHIHVGCILGDTMS
jgi:hypothetical protein